MASVKGEMPDKQRRFCQEYVIDFNGSRAAIASGYAEKTARITASKLLTKGNIQAYIRHLIDKQQVRNEITADRIIQEYARVAFANMGNYYDGKGNPKNISDMTEDEAAALMAYDLSMDGETRIRQFDKLKALEALAKRFGVDRPDIEIQQENEAAKEALSALAGLFDRAYNK